MELLRPIAKTTVLKRGRKITQLPVSMRIEQQYNMALTWLVRGILKIKKNPLGASILQELDQIVRQSSKILNEKEILKTTILENRTLIRFKKGKSFTTDRK